MDIFVLVEPSVLSDDDAVQSAEDMGGDDSDGVPTGGSQDSKAKRHMPNSPQRPTFLCSRPKRFRGSPIRASHRQSPPKINRISDTDDEATSLRKVSATSTSQRIMEVRERRRNQQEKRIQSVQEQSVTRATAALQRAEFHLQSKVVKAYKCDERITTVKEKRVFLDTERRVTLQSTSEKRTERARKRAELNIRARQDTARHVDRIAKVRQRRLNLQSERAEALQNEISARTRRATVRAEQNLMSKQRRARFEEKVARAKTRRALLEYERRSALLSSLDHRVQRASRNLEKQLQSRQDRAREEIRHAQLVSRRVRAARIIQRCTRAKHAFSGTITLSTLNAPPAMSQNEAAVLIQTWAAWKERVAAGRFLSRNSPTSTANKGSKAHDKSFGDDSIPEVALKKLVSIIDGGENGNAPSFEAVRTGMTSPSTLHAARIFLECLRPADQSIKLNDRTLLSAFLIASHPTEVLGDNQDYCTKKLQKASRVLVTSIQSLLDALHDHESSLRTKKPRKDSLLGCIRVLCVSATSYGTLFKVWKDADLANLVEGMTKSAEQSWLAYLISSEALSYIGDVLATSGAGGRNCGAEDPLLPIRLRHEASKSGSRSHIKRLRVSLNKLVGTEVGLRIIKEAKASALRQIAAENAIASAKQEVDEFYYGASEFNSDSSFGNSDGAIMTSSSSDVSEGGNVESHSGEEGEDYSKEGTSSTQSPPRPTAPKEILSNEHLVHRILLTDKNDYDKLTWDGQPRKEFICDKEYMRDWLAGQTSSLEEREGMSVEQLVTDNMKMAFFESIISDMKDRQFKPMQELLLHLHSRMRKLVPSRPDLHSHVQDDDARNADTTAKILTLLLTAATALANNLEAPSRASSTLDWMTNASTVSQGGEPCNCVIPYGFESSEEFVVASCAFLLFKTELCQLDIANFQLQKVAPLIHQMGREYELSQFKEKYGLDDLGSIEVLKRNLPATNAWLLNTLEEARADNHSEIARANSAEKRLTHVKSRGFVDGLLFTKNRLEMPEVFVLDAQSIHHIRDEARFAVIGCALGLHISNMSRAGKDIFQEVPLPAQLEMKREDLNSSLRAKYSDEDDFVTKVTHSALCFAQALAGSNLESGGQESLRNCVAAVLRGDDPVFKLLSQRVKQFFRVCCKWQQNTASPVVMRTGRSVLRGEGSISLQGNGGNHHSSNQVFASFARMEASKLGFALFCDTLVRVGEMSYKIVDLTSKLYGEAILDRLLVMGA